VGIKKDSIDIIILSKRKKNLLLSVDGRRKKENSA
jgi:hypothetical protein